MEATDQKNWVGVKLSHSTTLSGCENDFVFYLDWLPTFRIHEGALIGYLQSLHSIDIPSGLVADAAENVNILSIERARGVVVTASIHRF